MSNQIPKENNVSTNNTNNKNITNNDTDISTDKLLSEKKNDLANEEPAAAAVLRYLRKRGLGKALLELQGHLDYEKKLSSEAKRSKPITKEEKEAEMDVDDTTEMGRLEEKYNDQESALTLTTGGGMGYDLDAGPAILNWTNGPLVGNSKSPSGSGSVSASKVHIRKRGGLDKDGDRDHGLDNASSVGDRLEDKEAETDREKSKQDEARRCVQAFNELQTWVLSLPDEDASTNYFVRAGNSNATNGKINSSKNNCSQSFRGDKDDAGLSGTGNLPSTKNTKNNSSGQHQSHQKPGHYQMASFIPASIKPELLSVTFPLLVHTYCDLLENGLEKSAATLLSLFRHVHEPRHPDEFRDLTNWCTTAGILKLNEIVVLANEALSEAKTIRLSYDKSKNAVKNGPVKNPADIEKIERLEQQYKDVVERHTILLRRMKDYGFLKRIRSVKWNLNLSSMSFAYLASYLRSRDSLLPMSTMLQTRCHVVVESRDPLPFVPACILEDMVLPGQDKEKGADVRWAAPVHPSTRSNELGDLEVSILKDAEDLPFPKFNLQEEYETEEDYVNDKKRVIFNRKLLTNGFRRLAALEVKDEYESGMRRVNSETDHDFGNPLQPSIMMSTLCSSLKESRINDTSSPLEESGIELTCAKLCPPDGRRVAAGCSDSAVRIWSMDSWSSLNGKGSVDTINGASSAESVVVLLGHKRSLPVFDIDWNRDGRTLISAGGDGSLRLWDTKAVGSSGELVQVQSRKSHSSGAKSTLISTKPNTFVPGAKPESSAQRNGSALVCYQGHAPSSPVWSVSIAPCGYYFASAGADSTARLWCTDRPTPVRVFTGHYSENVNTVAWHPNCNYVMSGSADKTVRMWDVQSGNCVRLLSGCSSGVNKVVVSPSGQFVAGADYSGIVHIWDLRNGRKLEEFKHYNETISNAKEKNQAPMIQSMSFSPCGTAIASGTDDSNIRIWNTQGLGNHSSNPEFAALHTQGTSNFQVNKVTAEPAKIFRTNKTSILDLNYTKRNLLLSIGKYCAQ